MCASLPLAEYSELPSLEQHVCATPRVESQEGFDPWTGNWYRVVLYHCCQRVWCERARPDPARPSPDQVPSTGMRKEPLVAWRDTETYLSVESLDSEIGDLMELLNLELPFQRVRDGNVTAWVLRAQQAGVISASDRIQILAELRIARERHAQTRDAVL